jgi:hypothetical protein
MIISISKWRAMRQAVNLAETMSSDPMIRARARIRSMKEVARREQREKNPVPAQVVQLDTRSYEVRQRERSLLQFFDMFARLNGDKD